MEEERSSSTKKRTLEDEEDTNENPELIPFIDLRKERDNKRRKFDY